MLRHGHRQEVRDMVINRESDVLKGWTRSFDDLDVLAYDHPSTGGSITYPNGRMDVFGELHLDFARGTRVFGEIVLYFGSLFILSDVVRYQADQWLRLLQDHPAEAILVDGYRRAEGAEFGAERTQ